MTELTLHTGPQGEHSKINIRWHGHDRIEHQEQVDVFVLNRDAPGILQVFVNGTFVMEHRTGRDPTYCMNGPDQQIEKYLGIDKDSYATIWPLPQPRPVDEGFEM